MQATLTCLKKTMPNNDFATRLEGLTNQELAAAIDVAHHKSRSCCTFEPQFKLWCGHLEALLGAQKARALAALNAEYKP